MTDTANRKPIESRDQKRNANALNIAPRSTDNQPSFPPLPLVISFMTNDQPGWSCELTDDGWKVTEAPDEIPTEAVLEEWTKKYKAHLLTARATLDSATPAERQEVLMEMMFDLQNKVNQLQGTSEIQKSDFEKVLISKLPEAPQ